MNCRSCGDPIKPPNQWGAWWNRPWTREQLAAAAGRCEGCAAELLAGIIGPPPRRCEPARRSWREPLEETGPWQDNAIRDLEDR